MRRRGFLNRDERGVSDVIGTVLLLGITVTIVAAAGLSIWARARNEGAEAQLNLMASANPGSRFVNVTHAGGEDIDKGDLKLIVTVNEITVSSAPIGAAGQFWRLGDAASVTLTTPLAPGDRVTVSAVSAGRGTTLATALVDLPRSSANPLIGLLTVTASVSDTVVEPPQTFTLTAKVGDALGRKVVRTVLADLGELGGGEAVEMFDDGTHGDVTPGDGVYTTYVVALPGLVAGTTDIDVTAFSFAGSASTSAQTDVNIIVIDDDTEVHIYNTTLIRALGSQGAKWDVTSSSSGDLANFTFKVNLAKEPFTVGGASYRLTGARVWVEPENPGNGKSSFDLSLVCASDYSTPTPEGTTIKVFTWQGNVNQFDWERDNILYFFELIWTRTSGSGTLNEFVFSSHNDGNFVLRNIATNKVVNDNGWPSSANRLNCLL